MQRDFDLWLSEAPGGTGYSVGVIFLDVDGFKHLNSIFTESVVDRSSVCRDILSSPLRPPQPRMASRPHSVGPLASPLAPIRSPPRTLKR